MIQQDMRPEERRRNYRCDITYATNSELGFDYLRDNMAADMSEVVQREFQYCVIDEVDSILIDEARTLIISGQVERPQEKYQQAAQVANAPRVLLSWAKTASILKGITRWMRSSVAAPSRMRIREG